MSGRLDDETLFKNVKLRVKDVCHAVRRTDSDV